ncbi:MAG: TRAP transporter small permease subunit [Deltaproteobacteria bacterium]|nr:TRAP transporter small permease subunit [Deltaproteobacteria bacterium]
MKKIIQAIDLISEWSGKIGSLLILVLIFGMSYDMFTRYAFSKPNFWAYDMVYITYGAYTMLGMGFALLMKNHVRMDLFLDKLPPRVQAWIDIVCYLLLFFPLVFLLTKLTGVNAIDAIRRGERSYASVWRPHLGPFKCVLLYGFGVFLLQGISEFFKRCLYLWKGDANEP